jgi:hypothetical protein
MRMIGLSNAWAVARAALVQSVDPTVHTNQSALAEATAASRVP